MSEPVGPWWRQRKWRAVIAVGLTYVVTVFNATMSFVLLPDIADSFDVTLRVVGWFVIMQALVISSLTISSIVVMAVLCSEISCSAIS